VGEKKKGKKKQKKEIKKLFNLGDSSNIIMYKKMIIYMIQNW
jgi:hypothetical protein